MTDLQLSLYCKEIVSCNKSAGVLAEQYLDQLAKPPGSLGALESCAISLSSITGKLQNDISKRCILVFSADNGVVEEGVASGPQSLTAIQTINMLDGITGVSVLAKAFNTDVIVTDMGVAAQLSHPKLKNRKIRLGTDNIAKMPAMTKEEAILAISIGIETAEQAVNDGYTLMGIGEMGIGNTTTGSAVLSALLNLSSDEIATTVGRGAGLNDQSYFKKVSVIKKALSINKPIHTDPIDVLSKVGGFDIAAMAGAFIGCAHCKTPVVIDGFISIVAALVAVKICPNVRDYLFASHISHECGYGLAQKELSLSAYLDLNMRLGEGSGCPLMFAVLDASTAVMKNMATFEKACINTDYLADISKNHSF